MPSIPSVRYSSVIFSSFSIRLLLRCPGQIVETGASRDGQSGVAVLNGLLGPRSLAASCTSMQLQGGSGGLSGFILVAPVGYPMSCQRRGRVLTSCLSVSIHHVEVAVSSAFSSPPHEAIVAQGLILMSRPLRIGFFPPPPPYGIPFSGSVKHQDLY